MKFEIGDYVKGLSDSYGITNTFMKKGIVRDKRGDEIKVKVIEHDHGKSGVFWVDSEDFEKIGHAEMFDRDKFNELFKESKQKAVEYLSGANLSGADLRRADLSGANLSDADLRRADLSDADLRRANLSGADLSDADLSGANLSDANLRRADLSGANLSGAKELLNAINYMEAHFERTEEGYIVYKSFNSNYKAPDKWKIEPGSIIEENVNFDRCCLCGCGINVAPLEWVRKDNNYQPYKLLIRFEWLPEVVVPFNTDGKIRCGRAQIIEEVE